MTTAEKIKEVRQAKGFSQSKFAKRTKVFNQSQISKIEKGDRRITDVDLIVIAKTLSVSVSELFGESIPKRAN